MKRLTTSMLVALCLQAVGQSEFCLEGTIWDDVLQGCVPNNPSDLNHDGCVGLDDFLNHLAAYGEGCVDAVVETSWECGDPLDYQGYAYATMLWGGQCWFAENLRSENYQNGDLIPYGQSDDEWSSTSSGASSLYGEGGSSCYEQSPYFDACNEVWALEEYGRLYNWFAVDDPRGLCPSGWHVPTDDEFSGLFGSHSAGVKAEEGWCNDQNGENWRGFSGLPGGFRHSNHGSFSSAGCYGYWWSGSAPTGNNAWCHYLTTSIHSYRDAYSKWHGFSVRCIQDVE